MKQGDAPWPERLNAIIGRQVQRHRRRREWTAAELAARCTGIGLPMSRSKIANLENGRARQEGVGVAELLALGAALSVPPALLLLPLGSRDPVPMLPSLETDAWTAYKAFVGETLLSVGDDHRWSLRAPSGDTPVPIYDQHDTALRGLYAARGGDGGGGDQDRAVDHHLTMLAAARIDMTRRGWALPQLMSDVLPALAEPLLRWGYRQDEDGNLVEIAATGPEQRHPPQVES